MHEKNNPKKNGNKKNTTNINKHTVSRIPGQKPTPLTPAPPMILRTQQKLTINQVINFPIKVGLKTIVTTGVSHNSKKSRVRGRPPCIERINQKKSVLKEHLHQHLRISIRCQCLPSHRGELEGISPLCTNIKNQKEIEINDS